MAKISKKLQAAQKQIDQNTFYPLQEAIKLAKSSSYSSFDGSLDLAIKLNLDVRKADQQLRGSIALPNGTGKVVRVLAATNDAKNSEDARKAGSDIVADTEKLTEILKSGKFNFDIIVADPKMMPVLGKFGKELGPKGLMPNPKTGNVTTEMAKAIGEIKRGKANYRTDKNGIIHTTIGKVSMSVDKLQENAEVIINLIKKLKPSTVKGVYMQNLTISASMGPSVKIEI